MLRLNNNANPDVEPEKAVGAGSISLNMARTQLLLLVFTEKVALLKQQYLLFVRSRYCYLMQTIVQRLLHTFLTYDLPVYQHGTYMRGVLKRIAIKQHHIGIFPLF